jgi:tetratricopeptide (TPR) repeat protein
MADEGHVSAGLMRRFLMDQATREEAQLLIRHLIHGCEECSTRMGTIAAEMGVWRPGTAAPPSAYEEVISKVFDSAGDELRQRALDKLQGWGQWAALEPLQPEERTVRVLSDKSMHTWGLHQRLIEASRWTRRNDPLEGVDIVRLALTVAERIDPDRMGGEHGWRDLLAETYALLGDARRLASDFEGARSAYTLAWQQAEMGTNEPTCAAYITRLEAYWMIDMGEFETAEAALDECLSIYRQAGMVSQQAVVLVKMGIAIGYVDAARGVARVREALPLINAERTPRTMLCAQHDLAWFLADAGENQEALDVLDAARPLYRQFPDEHAQLRLHWLEGKLARNMGRPEEAAHIFQQLWEEFRVRELRHDLVLVTIDLAEVIARSGQVEEAAKLVRQVYPIMVNWGLHRHALATWLMLREALELRQLDGLFTRMRAYYRRYWNRPAAFPTE